MMPQRTRFLAACTFSIVAIVALIGACTVDFDPLGEGPFACDPANGTENNPDCLGLFECTPEGFCVRPADGPTPCARLDGDGDGYTRDGNADCNNPGLVDCNDENENIHPGHPELCDGIDNNCDMMPDELQPCDDSNTETAAFRVCQDRPQGAIPTCLNGFCAYRPAMSDQPGCEPIQCQNGSFPTLPDECQ